MKFFPHSADPFGATPFEKNLKKHLFLAFEVNSVVSENYTNFFNVSPLCDGCLLGHARRMRNKKNRWVMLWSVPHIVQTCRVGWTELNFRVILVRLTCWRFVTADVFAFGKTNKSKSAKNWLGIPFQIIFFVTFRYGKLKLTLLIMKSRRWDDKVNLFCIGVCFDFYHLMIFFWSNARNIF